MAPFTPSQVSLAASLSRESAAQSVIQVGSQSTVTAQSIIHRKTVVIDVGVRSDQSRWRPFKFTLSRVSPALMAPFTDSNSRHRPRAESAAQSINHWKTVLLDICPSKSSRHRISPVYNPSAWAPSCSSKRRRLDKREGPSEGAPSKGLVQTSGFKPIYAAPTILWMSRTG